MRPLTKLEDLPKCFDNLLITRGIPPYYKPGLREN